MTETTGEWKRCNECEKWKLVTEFYKHQRTPGAYRGVCKVCARRKQNERDARRRVADAQALAAAERSARAVRLIDCPPDPELGIRIYEPGTLFERGVFDDTLADGYWPTGSVWELVSNSKADKLPAKWEVCGDVLREVGGIRVIRGGTR